jgi:prepilin-type N-terminal cleavage/methylation domain-containing protein
MESIRQPKVKMRATISATGNGGAGGGGRVLLPPRSPRTDGDGGFTLVELLVVIAILATLFGLVVTMVGTIMGRGSEKSTLALILRLEDWADEYRSFTGYYPPDGIDGQVEDEGGAPLRGSAALYHELSRNVMAEEIYGSRRRLSEHPPVGTFVSRELTPLEAEDPDNPGVKEILDGWGTPFHYDNTENGRFKPQDGTVHYPFVPEDEHPDDPREGNREVDGQVVVERVGNQGAGFDLWSHGEHGHDSMLLPNVPVASWNVATLK